MNLQQRWHHTFGQRPYAADALLATAITALNLLFVTLPPTETSRAVDIWAVLLVTVPNLAIVFRRIYPIWLTALVTVLGFTYWVANYPNTGLFATMIALVYAVPVYTKSRRRASITQAVFFLALLAVLIAGYISPDEGDVSIGLIVSNVIIFQLAWIAGDTLARRREAIAELQNQVQAEQQKQKDLTAQAVVAEQNRIARELHDIVAHSMSVVVLQAEGARRMIGRDDAAAKSALDAIDSTGRQTLADIRGIVGLLRNSDQHQPAPSLATLETLVDASRDAGLPTEVQTLGEERDLPMMIELSAYRIIQESLTNARKYGGPLANAQIKLDYQPDSLSIEVSDTGRGAAATKSPRPGFGLIGIRERVEAFGGEFHHGPRPGGGYMVLATLPTEAP